MGKSTFAERLNAIIQEQNIRQIDLCKKTGIGKSAMSQYLRGSFAPKQQKLYDLAEALNVSEAWLMGYDVPRERKIVTSSEADDADSFYFTIHDNSMRDAFIPSGAVVLVHKHPYRASADTPYESGRSCAFHTKTLRISSGCSTLRTILSSSWQHRLTSVLSRLLSAQKAIFQTARCR